MCIEEVLTRTCRSIDDLGTIDDKELIHCKKILQSNDHCKPQRHSNAADKHFVSMEKSKQPNAVMKISILHVHLSWLVKFKSVPSPTFNMN